MNKEIIDHGFGIIETRETFYKEPQDKISFAVEQLEKVKEYWLKHEDVSYYIDNQIKQLKEGK